MLMSFASHRSSPARSGDDLDVQDPLMGGDQVSEVREEIGATLTALMPWGVSILAHAALVLLAFFLVWQTITPQGKPPIVPELGPTPNAVVKSEAKMTKLESSDSSSSFTVTDPVVADVEPVLPGLTDFAPVLPKDPGTGVVGPNDGPGKTKGPGLFDGDPVGHADRIVFVVDASGSMVDVMPFVVNELKRFVDELDDQVQATVLIFSGEGISELAAGDRRSGLRKVTPRYKDQFREWISLENHRYTPGGRGSQHVEACLAKALSYKPQIVYLLSDNLTGGGLGASPHELNQEDLIDLIREQNKTTPPARIHTYQFLYEDPLVRAGLQGTLERIAEETNGKYTFISQRTLNLR